MTGRRLSKPDGLDGKELGGGYVIGRSWQNHADMSTFEILGCSCVSVTRLLSRLAGRIHTDDTEVEHIFCILHLQPDADFVVTLAFDIVSDVAGLGGHCRRRKPRPKLCSRGDMAESCV